MKKYFVTGLVFLLPLALTIAIVMFIVNFLTTPFLGIVRGFLEYFDLIETNVFFLSTQEVQIGVSKIIILIFLFFFTVGLGALGRWVFVHYILNLWDYVLHRIPLFSSIYKTCQEVINTLFASTTNSFKQVVMVPFPSSETYSMGFVTAENIQGLPDRGADADARVAVFVPTTPNPTSGFVMMFKAKDLIYLDMKVEDAFKYIISCGVVPTPFKTISNEQAHQLPKETPEPKTT
jgi:uncharacterized membrane protein